VANINNKFSLINNILQNLDKLGDKKLMIKWKHIVDSNIEECMKYNIMFLNNFNPMMCGVDGNFNSMMRENKIENNGQK
jgi:hypothetical protein